MKPIRFDGRDFKDVANAYDRHNQLPALAQLILGLVASDVPDSKARHIAATLATQYLPVLRREVNRMQPAAKVRP